MSLALFCDFRIVLPPSIVCRHFWVLTSGLYNKNYKVMEHRYSAGCTESNNGVQSMSILLSDVARQHTEVDRVILMWLVFTSSCHVTSLGKNFMFVLICKLHCILKLGAACTVPVLHDFELDQTGLVLDWQSRNPLQSNSQLWRFIGIGQFCSGQSWRSWWAPKGRRCRATSSGCLRRPPRSFRRRTPESPLSPRCSMNWN